MSLFAAQIKEAHETDATALVIFIALFLAVTVIGFVAVRWRAAKLTSLDEWGLGGRRFGTVVTWFLLGGDLYTAYTFIAVPALMFGTVGVLTPLRLDELGAGASAIAAVFLVSAALEASVSPLVGRLSDRHGRLLPSLVGMAGGAVFMTVLPWPHTAWLLGALVVLAAPVIGLMWAPAIAMISDGAETLGLEQGFAFALVNVAWAVGQTSGAAGSARLADATSDTLAFLLLAFTCVATVAVLRRRTAARPAVV
jgi:MFS family permease